MESSLSNLMVHIHNRWNNHHQSSEHVGGLSPHFASLLNGFCGLVWTRRWLVVVHSDRSQFERDTGKNVEKKMIERKGYDHKRFIRLWFLNWTIHVRFACSVVTMYAERLNRWSICKCCSPLSHTIDLFPSIHGGTHTHEGNQIQIGRTNGRLVDRSVSQSGYPILSWLTSSILWTRPNLVYTVPVPVTFFFPVH